MIKDFFVFATQESFREAFENIVTKDVKGPHLPEQVITQKPWSNGLQQGVRFAKPPQLFGKLQFFIGHANYDCPIYTQLENIRKVIHKAIQQENRKAVIPYYRNFLDAYYFEATDQVVDLFNLSSGYRCKPNCNATMHCMFHSLYEEIVKPAFEELLASSGCSISYNKTVTQNVKPFDSKSVKNEVFPAIEITLSEDSFGLFPIPEKVEVPNIVQKGLVKAYETKTLLDFEIRAKDGSIKAHKLVLFVAVPYFAGLTNFKENVDNCLVLQDFALTTVQAALDFIYKGCDPFENAKGKVSAGEVLELSNQWDLPALKHFASIELAKQAECSDSQALAELSDKYDLPYLKKVAAYLQRKLEATKENGASSSSSSTQKDVKSDNALPLDAE